MTIFLPVAHLHHLEVTRLLEVMDTFSYWVRKQPNTLEEYEASIRAFADYDRARESLRMTQKLNRRTVELPLRIQSVANLREHWTQRAKRTKAHRNAAMAVPKVEIPCVVTLTRMGPRKLDSDNLVGGFKALRDGIADRLGVDDADPRVKWVYCQEVSKFYSARITIEPISVGVY